MPTRHIPPPSYPRLTALSQDSQRLILRAEEVIHSVLPYKPDTLQFNLVKLSNSSSFVPTSGVLGRLIHPLSSHVRTRLGHVEYARDRTEHEVDILQQLQGATESITAGSFEQFKDGLAMIASHAVNEANPIRADFAVGSDYDDAGNRWMYVRPESVDRELYRLWGFLKDSDTEPRIFRASIAMVSFLSVHPFRDGNGRVSRILANLLLFGCNVGAARGYIPFKELMAISQGGFEIACNQMRFFNRPSIVCRWVANAMLAMQYLRAKETDRNHGSPGRPEE